jgi:hypothetical protein
MRGLDLLTGLLGICLDESQHVRLELAFDLPVEVVADRLAEGSRHSPLDHWEDEAWRLLGEL